MSTTAIIAENDYLLNNFPLPGTRALQLTHAAFEALTPTVVLGVAVGALN